MDGELPGVEQLAIREHLKSCDSCRDEHESLLFTKRLLCGLKMKNPTESLETRIQRSIAAESHRPAPDSVSQTWWARAVAWWQVLAYPQKLRFTFAFTACSVLLALVSITPRALQNSDENGTRNNPGTVTLATQQTPAQRDFYIPTAGDRYRSSILPTFHDPADNPPPPNGTPVLIPVGADDLGQQVRQDR
jgi:hypothetical protein